MTMIGTSSGCLRKFSLQKRKCTTLSRLACEFKDCTEFAFGYDPDLCRFLQACDKRNDRFGQVEQIHNLGHAGTGKPHITGDCGHAERCVGGQYLPPFKGCLDRMANGQLRCHLLPDTLFHVVLRVFRIRDWMDDERTCAPPGKGNAHEDASEFKVRIG